MKKGSVNGKASKGYKANGSSGKVSSGRLVGSAAIKDERALSTSAKSRNAKKNDSSSNRLALSQVSTGSSRANAEVQSSGRGRGKQGTLDDVRLSEAKSRANAFKAARAHRSMEAAEDYTELVADLQEIMGEARIVSIAAFLGVSHVTALRTVNRLQEEGYLSTAPHKPVELTLKGKKLARGSKARHQVVQEFFEKLGVPRNEAANDAEGIEHHVGPATLRAMKRFLEN
jgi:DtxR family manganese transport transcriptional regulator